MKKIILAVIAVIIIVLIIVLGGNKNVGEVVKIGGLFHLTGYAAFAGEASRDGMTMALEDSGLSEDKVKIVIEDAHSDLKDTVTAAIKLTEVDSVVAVIGPEWTEFSEVAAPIAVRNKIPFISPWVAVEVPFIKPPYFWAASPSYRSQHTALAAYVAKHKLNKMALVYSKNSWSYTDIKMVKEELAKYPAINFVSEETTEQSIRDFRTIIAKIKSQNPDIIYAAIAEDEGYAVFLSQARQAGITVPISTFSSRATSAVVKDRYSHVMPGQLYVEAVPAARAAEFEAKYEKRFGKKVAAESAPAAYDMMTMILNAVKSGAKTSEDIVKHMQTMKPFEGYSGTIHFDEQGRLPMHKAVVKLINKQGVAEEVQ